MDSPEAEHSRLVLLRNFPGVLMKDGSVSMKDRGVLRKDTGVSMNAGGRIQEGHGVLRKAWQTVKRP